MGVCAAKTAEVVARPDGFDDPAQPQRDRDRDRDRDPDDRTHAREDASPDGKRAAAYQHSAADPPPLNAAVGEQLKSIPLLGMPSSQNLD